MPPVLGVRGSRAFRPLGHLRQTRVTFVKLRPRGECLWGDIILPGHALKVTLAMLSLASS